VAEQIVERLPATIGLMLSSLLFSTAIGIIIGLISAANQNKILDQVVTVASYVGISIPSFGLQ